MPSSDKAAPRRGPVVVERRVRELPDVYEKKGIGPCGFHAAILQIGYAICGDELVRVRHALVCQPLLGDFGGQLGSGIFTPLVSAHCFASS